ncbi:MAG: hypothetical protein JW982_14165 [Spirochaetes bacterium]|nr:hypothetical protein [Spirochaetota bacterium]
MKRLILFSFILPVLWSCEGAANVPSIKMTVADELYVPSEPSSRADYPFSGKDSKNVKYISSKEDFKELNSIISDNNITVIIKDGVYLLDKPLYISGNNVTIRSESGSRENVIISGGTSNRGKGGIEVLFRVEGNHFTICDVSIGRSRKIGIEIIGENENKGDFLTVSNVCFFDISESMILASWDSQKPGNHADSGVVEFSLFEYTDNFKSRSSVTGIDVQRGQNWKIRDNIFKNIKAYNAEKSPGLICLYNHADGTIIKNNRILNCQKGITLGMDGSPHYNGILVNNTIHVTLSAGISLSEAVNTKVYNNTVFIDGNDIHSIECGFNCDSSRIINNLTNSSILTDDENVIFLTSNFEHADNSYFKNIKTGDFHLRSKAKGAINSGMILAEVVEDADSQIRQGSVYDIGSDEAF